MSASTDPYLIEAIQRRASEFAAQLRGLDTHTSVPNLEWSVAELAEHVAMLPRFWSFIGESGADFVPPDNFSDFVEECRTRLSVGPLYDADEAADLIQAEFADYSEQLAMNSDRWLYGMPVHGDAAAGLAINELVLHGRDLAGVSGQKPPIYTEAEAHAAAAGVFAILAPFVDPAKAEAQPDGVYHVRLRGGQSYTWTKSGPALSVTQGKPGRADAHMVADPSAFLMTSLGRISQVRAALTGKLITYGKRPWRFLGLGAITVDDV